MCQDCLTVQNHFQSLFCIYRHLVNVKGSGENMWLKNYSSRSRELRDLDGTVLAIFSSNGIYGNGGWHLRTPSDDVTDGIPSGYETEDVSIEDFTTVFNLTIGGIQ